jgi:hypothetical protein
MKPTQSGLRPIARLITLAIALAFSATGLFTTAAAGYAQSFSEGDVISFGRYEQDNNESNGTESIAWRVMVIEDDRVLLISEGNLDCRAFNPEEKLNGLPADGIADPVMQALFYYDFAIPN